MFGGFRWVGCFRPGKNCWTILAGQTLFGLPDFVSDAWDATGGKVVSAVNNTIVKPLVHVAGKAGHAISSGARRVVKFVKKHKVAILKVAALTLATLSIVASGGTSAFALGLAARIGAPTLGVASLGLNFAAAIADGSASGASGRVGKLAGAVAFAAYGMFFLRTAPPPVAVMGNAAMVIGGAASDVVHWLTT